MKLLQWMVLVMAVVPAACGRNNTDLAGAKKYGEDNPILKVMMLYGSFQTDKGRPPQDIDELKAYAKQLPKEKLDSMGIQDVDAICISPRDNEPYAIAPVLRNAPGGMPRVAIYERKGVGGKRMVASMGNAREMDESQLKTYVPNLK